MWLDSYPPGVPAEIDALRVRLAVVNVNPLDTARELEHQLTPAHRGPRRSAEIAGRQGAAPRTPGVGETSFRLIFLRGDGLFYCGIALIRESPPTMSTTYRTGRNCGISHIVVRAWLVTSRTLKLELPPASAR